LPGLAAAEHVALLQASVQQLQDQHALQTACALLQERRPDWPSSSNVGSSRAAQAVEQLLDSVLPAAAAAWASSADSYTVTAAVAYSCCHERAVQLLLVLQAAQPPPQQDSKAGFNTFGSYQHMVQLQLQLAQALTEYTAQTGSSSQVLPQQLSLHASNVAEQPQQDEQQQQASGESHAAQGLASMLAAALQDAVQRLQLCGAEVTTTMLLRQQVHSCTAEVELLGHMMQVC
jgi:hypothetical protein